ncbi:ISL3 family transposase, partial [Lactobacillus buchneri]|nr:ISL3 family transposase [Lentilactobacillus buchneri]MQM80577.1 ISL3 family transposase [Lentilactobacillus buchneri]
MSNDTTKMLLGIDDEHLKIENGKIGDDGVIRLNGSLNYSPKACRNCGVINDHQIIG